MQIKWKEIVIALVLGLVCPAVLLSAATDRTGDEQQPPDHLQTTGSFQQESENSISVLMDNGEIKQMELDTYLVSVVLCEMPAEFEHEALKAQTVVARTYTLRRVETGGKHVGAAVCTDPSCCQGYKTVESYLENGGSDGLLNKVREAVSATSGQVLLYNGELIEATYFSCSGGRTEDALAVWGADIPYLQATDSPGEEGATHYIDTVSFNATEFLTLLGLTSSKSSEEWIESITYTDGGGVNEIRICGENFKGTTMRQLLGLRSTSFVISVIGDKVTITTKGFGHRVGMSQYGADAMAVAGNDYTEILAHYYKGTSLSGYSG